MQAGLLDRITLIRVAELRSVSGDDYAVMGFLSVSKHMPVAFAGPVDLSDMINIVGRENMPQRLHQLDRCVLINEDTHYAARRVG